MSSPLSPDPWPRESDSLDRLLLRAPLAPTDGWFTARTLARCRNSEPVKTGWSWTRIGRRWAVGGALAFCLCAFTVQQVHHSHTRLQHREKNVQEAFEIVASFGSDSDSSASTSWQEDSSY